MSSHNHSPLGLNPLPGEDKPAQKFTTTLTATLPSLEDDTEPWTPTPSRPEAAVTAQAPPTPPAQPVIDQAFCQFCGGRVIPDAVLCVSCGRQIKALQGPATQAEPKPDDKPASAAEFVLMVILTLVIPLAGFLFGIIGLSRRGKQAQGGVLLALSIIFGAIYFVYFSTPHH